VSVRQTAGRVVEGILLAAAVAMILGAILGQPILFGFVETGSMQPGLQPGDGFIAVPSIVTGEPEVGDVVVFEAETLQGGGLTTHRIVRETPDGYVTKGDANPFTDQDGGEPLVTEDTIVAEAVTVGDTVIAIPFLGIFVLLIRGVVGGFQQQIASLLGLGPPYGTQGAGIFLVTLGAIVMALTVIQDARSGPSRSRSRSRSRPGTVDMQKVTVVLLVVVLLPANAAMLLPAGSNELVVEGDVVTESPSIEPGEPAQWDYSIRNFGLIPVALSFDSPAGNATVPASPQVLGPRANSTVEITMDAPPPGERAVAEVNQQRYLLVLPPSVIDGLHDLHPFVALLAINIVLMGAVLVVVARAFGFGMLRLRWGSGVSLRTRLRRRFG
jgi:signal peptidase